MGRNRSANRLGNCDFRNSRHNRWRAVLIKTNCPSNNFLIGWFAQASRDFIKGLLPDRCNQTIHKLRWQANHILGCGRSPENERDHEPNYRA